MVSAEHRHSETVGQCRHRHVYWDFGVPGTTFSNPVERGEYDNDGKSCLTLAELEKWFALAIVGRYHGELHGKLREPPVAKWRRGVANAKLREVTQAEAFFVDFLPIVRRRITREGIRVDHISNFNALRVENSDPLKWDS